MVTADTDDGVVMAVEHRTRTIAALQFHPESMMASATQIGLPIMEAVLRRFAGCFFLVQYVEYKRL
jgi:anthranilate synthase